MRHFVKFAGRSYRLEVYGNGLSYVLANLPASKSVCVQGDDALAFEAELERIEAKFPDWEGDAICAWLWDQCEYGSAAS